MLFGMAGLAHGQQDPASYPTRPIHFVIPTPPGGPNDVIGRLIADRLSRSLGQPVIVENKPGASQTLGTAFVAKARPDGYTLLFTSSTPIVMAPFTNKKLPYDATRDLVVISHVGTTPLVLYANAATGARSVKDVIRLAKAQPDAISYGSYGNGSAAHLLGEYFSRQAGLRLVHVPYKGVAPEIADLVGGQVNLGVADIGVPAPFVKAGKLRAVAVAGARRSAVLPEVPTFAEQGIAGMEPFTAWWGMFAPHGTPAPIVERLAAEVGRIVKSPDFAARMTSFGGEPTGLSGGAADAILREELAHWQKIVADLPDIKFD